MRPTETIDDLSSVADAGAPPAPVVVLVAVGTAATARVFDAGAGVALGRRIEAGAQTADVDDERMSRDHATVRFDRGAWVIGDRGSRNGTFVDGERITGEVRKRGDVVVRLGHSVFLLVADGRGYDAIDAADDGDLVIGPELARTNEQVARHATSPTLLVHGESGAGKEHVARLYHRAGPRAGGPFVAVNCAAIPEGVAERLLFGSRKGAFSGATDAVGYLQAAHAGTLFLDEIADLDLAVQAKLLRALESGEVTPIGANSPIAIELGVVAASHRELRAAVAAQSFRDDLYYRLARAVVHLPPLRARKLDIVRLVRRELAATGGAKKLLAHARLVETCCLRPWPGNIRELRSAVRQAGLAALASDRDVARPEHLPRDAGLPVGAPAAAIDAPTVPTRAAASPAGVGKEAIVAALATAGGVVSVAARALGLHRTQLYRLMDKHGLARGPDEG